MKVCLGVGLAWAAQAGTARSTGGGRSEVITLALITTHHTLRQCTCTGTGSPLPPAPHAAGGHTLANNTGDGILPSAASRFSLRGYASGPFARRMGLMPLAVDARAVRTSQVHQPLLACCNNPLAYPPQPRWAAPVPACPAGQAAAARPRAASPALRPAPCLVAHPTTGSCTCPTAGSPTHLLISPSPHCCSPICHPSTSPTRQRVLPARPLTSPPFAPTVTTLCGAPCARLPAPTTCERSHLPSAQRGMPPAAAGCTSAYCPCCLWGAAGHCQ